MDKISEHISFAEATKSQTATKLGIENKPSVDQVACMQLLAEMIFEPLRNQVGKPIFISSFFRSKELNSKTPGSSITSQHCKGEAMDLDADILGGLTNRQIFDFIRRNLDFDQLIWEHGDKNNPEWVHVSYKNTGNRKQVLKTVSIGGEVKYLNI